LIDQFAKKKAILSNSSEQVIAVGIQRQSTTQERVSCQHFVNVFRKSACFFSTVTVMSTACCGVCHGLALPPELGRVHGHFGS